MQHWSLNGDKRSQVPCSPSNVFNLCVNDKSDNNKVCFVGCYIQIADWEVVSLGGAYQMGETVSLEMY